VRKIIRRLFLGGIFVVLYAATGVAAQYRVYIGTYTHRSNSEGVYVLSFDAVKGKTTSPELAVKSQEPSFLAIHPDGKRLYAVNETNTGEVSAFAIEPETGKLSLLNQVSSKGTIPAHITLDNTATFALVANYGGGSIAVFKIGSDGRLSEMTAFVQHTGSSTDPERQREPHPHQMRMSPDNRFVFVPDLGTNEVITYRFDEKIGALARHAAVTLKPCLLYTLTLPTT
jgi:6-phosphogluconolactonase